MKNEDEALKLAQNLVDIGSRMGKDVVALITDMDQPLGYCVGNTLEMLESIDVLCGKGPEDVATLTIELGAYMLKTGGVVTDVARGRQRMQEVLTNGAGLQKFQQLVELQGGDPAVIADPSKFRRAAHQQKILAQDSGYVQRIDSEAIGIASMWLGAGRERLDSHIDHAVGIILKKKVGDVVEAGEPLCVLEYNDDTKLRDAVNHVQRAYTFSASPPAKTPLIKKVLTGSSEKR